MNVNDPNDWREECKRTLDNLDRVKADADKLEDRLAAALLQVEQLKRQSAVDVHVMGEISKCRDSAFAQLDVANLQNDVLLQAIKDLTHFTERDGDWMLMRLFYSRYLEVRALVEKPKCDHGGGTAHGCPKCDWTRDSDSPGLEKRKEGS